MAFLPGDLISFKYNYRCDREDIKGIVSQLNKLLGHDEWFIAGSFAMKAVKHPGDIDIFFYSEDAFLRAINTIKLSDPDLLKEAYDTGNALSIQSGKIGWSIQLIKKHFGTIDEILNTFDLNICKKAITSDGDRKAHRASYETLRIDRVNVGTFKRYFKYVMRMGLKDQIPERGKQLVDRFIGDNTMVDDYYNKEVKSIPVNKALLQEIKNFHTVRDYAYQQAAVHAPELLI